MIQVETSKELKIANSLYAKAGHFGGALINKQFESPEHGFMVSIEDGPVFNSLSEVNEHEVSKFIKDNLVCESACYFGSWVDPETKKVYFDLSINIFNEETALNCAKLKDQISIYDVSNKKTIYLLKE
jgi:hypothetical protein